MNRCGRVAQVGMSLIEVLAAMLILLAVAAWVSVCLGQVLRLELQRTASMESLPVLSDLLYSRILAPGEDPVPAEGWEIQPLLLQEDEGVRAWSLRPSGDKQFELRVVL